MVGAEWEKGRMETRSRWYLEKSVGKEMQRLSQPASLRLALSPLHCFGARKEWGVVAPRSDCWASSYEGERSQEPRNCSFVPDLEVSPV